jgi:hypothetical protein
MGFDSGDAHPLMKILPVEWDFAIPYGVLHSPSDVVRTFHASAARVMELKPKGIDF